MRQTIEVLLDYIDNYCETGRDDLEIGILYTCIGALYSALDSIKSIEDKNNDVYEEDDLA